MTSAWTRRRRAQQQQLHHQRKRKDTIELQFNQSSANAYPAWMSKRRRSMALSGRYFRGVAFADFANAASYERSLALDGQAHMKGDSGDDDDDHYTNDSRVQYHRPLRVRPTKTILQLQDIAQRTRELVLEKIERAKLKRDQQHHQQQQ